MRSSSRDKELKKKLKKKNLSYGQDEPQYRVLVSGNPKKILRRGKNKLLGMLLSKLHVEASLVTIEKVRKVMG
jgi:hypothetical protein